MSVSARDSFALIEAALQQPLPERLPWLRAQCAGDPQRLDQLVECLLDALGAERVLTPLWPAGRGATTVEAVADPALSRFEELSELGRGGMGVVWRARQHFPVRREVALKRCQGEIGESDWQRLLAERQTLARLRHPHIAALLEAGESADGTPYFAMELVEQALPITDWCDQHGADLDERLRLFLQACEAVQYAHQQAILHRDVKPANVLVTAIDGTPTVKVIDFGIAQGLDDERDGAATAELAGTPSYMAPETSQLGDRRRDPTPADTRSDVYSLGVLLFELLVGEVPLRRQPGEGMLDFLHRSARCEAVLPSHRWSQLPTDLAAARSRYRNRSVAAVGRRLRGDLDAIVSHCLAERPEQRYASVSELAADLRRHRRHELVLARPTRWSLTARKALRRHRLAVAAVSAVMVLLGGGMVARQIEAQRARSAETQARLAQAEAEQASQFLADLFSRADPARHLGDDPSASEMLHTAARQLLDQDGEQRPPVRARLLQTVATVLWRRGDPSAARPLAEAALQIRQSERPGDPAAVGLALQIAGTLASEVGDYAQAEPRLRQALALRTLAHGQDSREALNALLNLAAVLRETDQLDAAEAALLDALQRLHRRDEAQSAQAQLAWNNLANLRRIAGHLPQAEQAALQALALAQALYADDHPWVARGWQTLAEVHLTAEHADAAGAALAQAQRRFQALYPEAHENTARNLTGLGQWHALRAESEQAEQRWQAAEQIYRQAGSRFVVHPIGHRLRLRLAQGRWAEADALAAALFEEFNQPDASTAGWLSELRCDWQRSLQQSPRGATIQALPSAAPSACLATGSALAWQSAAPGR